MPKADYNALVACIGGGSNAIGLFHPFLDDRAVDIYGVEAAGKGLNSGLHAASLTGGKPGDPAWQPDLSFAK